MFTQCFPKLLDDLTKFRIVIRRRPGFKAFLTLLSRTVLPKITLVCCGPVFGFWVKALLSTKYAYFVPISEQERDSPTLPDLIS
jgi:hypothetical protein